MAQHPFNNSILRTDRTRMAMFMCLALFVTLVLPSVALAQLTTAKDVVCGAASGINTILNAVSLIVVTVAVVFSGYQIAFAHKRIGDVAPVMIGGVLIGGAGQIAKLFLAGNTAAASGDCTPAGAGAALLGHFLNNYV